MPRQKITTYLWFDNKAEEAANFYVSLFKDSKINSVVTGPGGVTMIVEFTLVGIEYIALNGGPHYKFTEAISLFVDCADQAEIDDLWEKLSAGGSKSRCGWLKDKFGVSWQIVPTILMELLRDKDPQRSARVMKAMMKMNKIVIADLKKASQE